jgi:AcrR family transcriptional regulator
MARSPAPDRLRDFVEASIRLFIARGYRRTQMADVTDVLGLSAGSIYRYIESKEALFDLALRFAIDPVLPSGVPLPVRTPPPGATLDYLSRMLSERGRIEALDRALKADRPRNAEAELEGIARELIAKLARHGSALRMIESCALDWPELAVLWFDTYRAGLIRALETYLRRRIGQRLFRPLPDTLAASALLIHLVFYQIVGRHDDPYPTPMDDVTAERTALAILKNSLIPETPPAPVRRSGAASTTRRKP